ncbi:hypothetical protein CONLIGDRAFT_633178 [Coniochaeta ligniaria NRRL 30616]|uniref:Uncharacterized protein n=1 Tax=Coniochaeta ligniaria NRRL 30616 TaxID=1408157 RepID=A0A1J7IN05_9PEZI|nr:hypothetical protein CONLIGDRAFT_633178 [Coniochaeta ligniaria NRRL 30616]
MDLNRGAPRSIVPIEQGQQQATARHVTPKVLNEAYEMMKENPKRTRARSSRSIQPVQPRLLPRLEADTV